MSDHLNDSDIHDQETSAIMDAIRRDPRGRSLIEPAEEIELVNRLKANPHDRHAWDRFVLANAGLVTLTARKYRGRCVNATVGDLIQEGNIGLMKAIPRYTPFHEGKRIRFTTYAVEWVAQRIRICVEDNRNAVRLKHAAEHYQTYRRALREFELANWREPSIPELAKALGWTEDRTLLTRSYGQAPISLNEPAPSAHGEERTFGDAFQDESIAHPFSILEKDEIHDTLYAALNRLDDRAVLIVVLRNGMMGAPEMTLVEVADFLGISAERVRQCEVKAKRAIAKAYTLREDFLSTLPTEARQGRARCARLAAKIEDKEGLVASLGLAPWKIEEAAMYAEAD